MSNKDQIYKQQFELNEKAEDKINLIEFKKQLITFKAEHESYTFDQLRKYLFLIIETIHYHPEKLEIKFKLLPWKEEFTIK